MAFHSGIWGIVILAASVCPLMEEDKRLVQASCWEGLAGLAMGKTALRGGTMQSKSLIQLSADGCSLPVKCLSWGNPIMESVGSEVRLWALWQGYWHSTSKRIYAKMCLPGLLLPVPLPLPTHAFTGDPQTCKAGLAQSLVGGHCSFPLGPGTHSVFLVLFKSSVSPKSLPNAKVGKSDVGPRTFATVRELLWY